MNPTTPTLTRKALVVLVAVTTLLSFAGLAGAYLSLCDLTNHFRVYYAIGAVPILGTALVLRRWSVAVLAGGCLLYNMILIAPWLQSTTKTSSGPIVKLLQFNVLYYSRRHQQLLQLVREEKPDLIALQEVDDEWVAGLAELRRDYPAQYLEPRLRGMGIAIYSRYPLREFRTIDFQNGKRPLITGFCAIGDKMVGLVVIHPPTPFSSDDYATGIRIFDESTEILNKLPTPKILIGDFNDTPWSARHRHLLSATGMRNVRSGRGIEATWPTWLPLSVLRLPIDQCLVSSDIAVANVRTARSIGSDHLPLVVEIGLDSKR